MDNCQPAVSVQRLECLVSTSTPDQTRDIFSDRTVFDFLIDLFLLTISSDNSDTTARLQWLEGLVKERLPDVDLTAGPATETPHNHDQIDGEDSHIAGRANTTLGKRTRESASDDETSIRKRARQMALDLGLLSLDINASQVQYLGSSSGSFFASLLQGRDNTALNEPTEPLRQEITEDHRNQRLEYGQDDVIRSSDDFFNMLKENLPPRKQCDGLVEHYFSHYHPDYPVLHGPSFESVIDGLYRSATEADTQELQYNGWPADIIPFRYNGEMARIRGKEVINIPVKTAAAQLFFVLGIAAHLHTRRRSFSIDPTKFQKQALGLAQATLSNVSLPSLQVIILLVLQSFLTQQGGNTWITLHSAMAYAIDLGIHRDVKGSTRFSPVAIQMRRRVFFCTYTLDRFVEPSHLFEPRSLSCRLISTAQGRPLGFQDDTLDLSLPSVLPAEDDIGVVKQDQACMAHSIVRFKWVSLVSKIKYQFYRLRNNSSNSTVANMQVEIHNELDEWLADANQTVNNFEPADRARLQTKLKIDYHFTICLLYQPSQACVSPSTTALERCFDSATQRIRLYGTLHDQNNLYVSWPTTHGIFLAGATLVYSIWMSSEVRLKVTVSSLAKDFRLCSNLLTLGSEWWPLAQRGRRSFERLADSTIDSLLSNNEPVPTSSTLPTGDAPTLENDLFASLNFQSPATNIEEILQTFLQNELPLDSTFDMFDASGFSQGPDGWQQDGLLGFDPDESNIGNGQGF